MVVVMLELECMENLGVTHSVPAKISRLQKLLAFRPIVRLVTYLEQRKLSLDKSPSQLFSIPLFSTILMSTIPQATTHVLQNANRNTKCPI